LSTRATGIPRTSWADVRRYLNRAIGETRRRSEGVHTTLIGPTGRGKSHLALELLELYRCSAVLVTKPRDDLMSALRHSSYTTARSPRELNELPWTPEGELLFPRVLYWPTFNARRPLAEQTRLQSESMRSALHWAYTTGQWAVLVDEGNYFSTPLPNGLGLKGDLGTLWMKGRSQGVSLIFCGQRPFSVPQYALDQARFLFLWKTSERRSLERLAEINSGIDPRLIQREVVRLDAGAHEALFVDCQEEVLGRVIAPARAIGRAARREAQAVRV
jgi:hypothetical protein